MDGVTKKGEVNLSTLLERSLWFHHTIAMTFAFTIALRCVALLAASSMVGGLLLI